MTRRRLASYFFVLAGLGLAGNVLDPDMDSPWLLASIPLLGAAFILDLVGGPAGRAETSLEP